ncbi:MAG TPA: TerB family tellurite resistance protein, partial [Anaerolineales bacterium]|nr:TerB family tellurite resistance protein [Anaerolineales bacterium]
NRGTNIGLSSRTSALFEMYTESPVGPEERERLVKELQENVWSEEDRALILSALQSMIEADGKITEEEKAVLNDITARIESVNTGFLGDMGRLVGGAMHRRSKAVSSAPNRERYFEDYLKNKVYYEMRRRLDLGEANLEIPEDELRKLSLIGGLMARVAKVDKIVLEDEMNKIRSMLKSDWGLSDEAAAFVTEVATSDASADMDYLRMSREFLEVTIPAERANLLDILFAVANADGAITSAERHEIHKIADYLLMSSDSVEAAYSKVAD